jgi:uncharacterized membrane protein YfcA
MLEIVGLIVLGVFAGTLAATLGVGGGIIFVPALVALFSFDQLQAQGTSLAIIVMTAIVGTVTHARAGRVDWKVVAVVGSSGIIAAFGAATLAQTMNEELLRRVFAIVLAFLAVRMGLRTYRLWKDSTPVDGS